LGTQSIEEILAFEDSVFGEVCAMEHVSDSVVAELCSQCVWSQVLGDFGVVGTAEVSE